MKHRILWLLAVGMLLAPAAHAQVARPSAGDSVPPAPGLPNFVSVVLEGIKADSVRAPFMAGFRGAFSDASFPTDRPGLREGEMLPGIPVSNRFRLLEGTQAKGTWQAQVSIEWLAAGQAAPGLKESSGGDGGRGSGGRDVGVAKKPSPGKKRSHEISTKAPTTPFAPRFPGARVTYWALTPEAVAAGARVIPDHEVLRFRFAATAGPRYFMQAGRRAALLLLESLHHQSEDLDADMRLRLEDCDRGGA